MATGSAKRPNQNVLVASNVTKSKTMTFQPIAIRLGVSEEDIGQLSTGKGATYREWLRIKTSWTYCRVEMTSGSMIYRLQLIHVTELYID